MLLIQIYINNLILHIYYDTLMEIFKRSEKDGIPTNKASDLQAEDRIKHIGELKSFYLPYKKSFKIRG